MTWIIKTVEVQDLFGFSGKHRFPSGDNSFGDGAIVYHMPNHTGKSSLANSIHWALTGKITNPQSVSKNQYFIFNTHSGDSGEPEIVLTLIDTISDEELVITRRGHKEKVLTKTQKEKNLEPLEVEIGAVSESDWDAGQELIEATLGLKTSSLSKCGVIRHTDMTRFVSGHWQDVAEVMNDMLDLGKALVDIAPVLHSGKKKAEEVRKRIDTILKTENPIDQWNRRTDEIQNEISNLKDELQTEGFTANDVSGGGLTQEAIEERLSRLEKELKSDSSGLDLNDRIASIESNIDAISSTDQTSVRMLEISKELDRIDRMIITQSELIQFFEELTEQYDEVIGEGNNIDLVELATAKEMAKKKVDIVADKIRSIETSSNLATAILKHIETHDIESCPVCGNTSDSEQIQTLATELLGPVVTARLTELKSEREAEQSGFDNAESKYQGAGEIQQQISSIHPQYSEFIGSFPDEIELVEHPREDICAGEVSLFSVSEQLGALSSHFKEMKDDLTIEKAKLDEVKTTYQTEVIQPLRNRLREVIRLLVLVTKESDLTRHIERRHEYEARAEEYEDKLTSARDVKMMLHHLHSALVGSQEESARQAVQDALPLVNEVYSKVCTNPEFNRLHIQVNLKEDQRSGARIEYHVMADSNIRSLGGQAATRLSDGDQQVANLAILMALASAPQNRFSTLLLDDPCSDMDRATKERWANVALPSTVGRQLIVLTNSEQLAGNLEDAGANRFNTSGWDGGILPDHKVE